MTRFALFSRSLLLLLMIACAAPARADDKVVGLIPKAPKPVKIDGRLDDWEGAFVTPVHIGHPDFLNRGAEFLYLWDEENLYIGLRCLDQKPAHVGRDDQIWNGDAVEFYLDTRGGEKLGGKDFDAGTLHMFWTGFTGTDVKPRWAVRDLPAFRDFKLKGVEVAAEKTAWGYIAEFKLPWANFPNFTPKNGEVIGIDCELCSSDGGPRSDRTFVYSSPASVSSPAAFGRVQLVEKVEGADLKSFGRALLPMSVTMSANYDHLYATAGISPTIAAAVAKIEGKILDSDGKVRKTSAGNRRTLEGSGLLLWTGNWELFDLLPGTYTLQLAALDKANATITTRSVRLLHGEPGPAREGQNPSPMIDNTCAHPRVKEEKPEGQREKLEVGTLFLPAKLKREGKMPLFVHFHGGSWLPEVAAAANDAAVVGVQLGSGSGVYAKPFEDAALFGRLLKEAETKAGVQFDPVGLTGWSAGYGAVREILKVPEHYERVRFVVLIDGMHTGYVNGKPGPLESGLTTEGLDVFVKFARDAVAGKKQMIVTHSEIFPGTFASSTETADYLLKQLQLRRQAVLKWGPMQMQQLSEARQGNFTLMGFAGNSAPDHVDQLHSLPDYLKWLRWD
jgi:hypothetical protein